MNGRFAFHWIRAVLIASFLFCAVPAYSQEVSALAIDARTPDTIYAGTRGGGVFRSTDGGGSWSPTGLPNGSVESLIVDLQTPSTVYALAWGGILKSTNGGQSWSGVNRPNDEAVVTALAIDLSNPSTLYAALQGAYIDEWGLLWSTGTVARSTGRGANWTFVSLSSGVLALTADPLDPSKLVAGTAQIPGWMGPEVYGDVFTSADGGATWNPLYMWLGSVYLAAARGPPSTIYVVTSSGAVVNLSTGTVGYPPKACATGRWGNRWIKPPAIARGYSPS
jgi:hypothetical protein